MDSVPNMMFHEKITNRFSYKKKLHQLFYIALLLLNIAYKIFSNIVYEKLKLHAERIIGQYQRDFRFVRSTTTHIFAIQQNIEKALEHNNNIHILFIDLTMYNSII